MVEMARDWMAERVANQLASVGHLLLLVIGLYLRSPLAWLCILAAIAILSVLLWAANHRRTRAVVDTPTSRIASAHQGYVEVVGTARQFDSTPLISPLSGTPCVWFRYRIERRQGHHWRVTSEGRSEASFRLDDGSGSVVVDPHRAEVVTDHRRRWYKGDQCYSEWLLLAGTRVYALGEFSTVGGSSAELDHRTDVVALLDHWKRDPKALRRRFDLDGNGEIDMQEWELARRAARREVEQLHVEIRSQPGTHVLRAPHDGRLFVLSSLDPDLLSARYRLWTRIQLCIAAIAGSAALVLLFARPPVG
ncbi:MAG: hypothetical protein KIS79_14140 [Burkholderiales bacterium]|nr:hypothetical protein [Burkholderiales bacterium]